MAEEISMTDFMKAFLVFFGGITAISIGSRVGHALADRLDGTAEAKARLAATLKDASPQDRLRIETLIARL
jgi:hypothetical protein